MAQWNRSESGILRKFKKKDNFEDLLVFGYACKIFRDDTKALYIDQGKHLIPWMGDEKLKIDRYDCRGHLSEIKRFEATSTDYESTRWLGLDENERKLEQLCDEERYYSLTINEEEDEMYKEEEKKRNQTNEFQYSYDVPMQPEQKESIPTVPENDEDEKYVPPPDLDLPTDMILPSTMKENARIEKTAMFVSTQGPQMEILIKAKQSDNPQFSFLGQKDPLFKFYRHILNAIKSGRYKTTNEKSDANTSNSSETEVEENYLHPSLVSSDAPALELPLPAIPSVPYRPNVNCAYSQLVNRIQSTTSARDSSLLPTENEKSQNSNNTEQNQTSIHPNMENLTYEQQQYYQYYMQQQYYDYYNQISENSGNEETKLSMQAYLQQMAYAQYFQQPQTQNEANPYARIVSNVSNGATYANSLPEKSDIHKEAVIYDSTQEKKASIQQTVVAPTVEISTQEDSISIKPSLLSLMQNYNTDSEGASSEDEQEAKIDYDIPDDETKIVIDKMASYVVKNGAEFEDIVKSRLDPRFVFLNDDNKFNKYYRKRVEEERKQKNEVECSNEMETENSDVKGAKAKEKKVIAPVSFSIKKVKEEVPKEIKSALPVDEETDEEVETSDEPVPPISTVSQPPSLVSSTKTVHKSDLPPNEEKSITETNIPITEASSSEGNIPTESEKCDATNEKSKNNLKKGEISKSATLSNGDPILEMIDLTEDNIWNEDDISIAEDEISKSPTGNRALQLERRRKALAFLKLKSSNSDQIIDLSNSVDVERKNSEEDVMNQSNQSISSDTKDKNTSDECEPGEIQDDKVDNHKKQHKSKRRKSRESRKYDIYEASDSDCSKISDRSESRNRKSYKRKKSHKRKHSKCKHHSKSKKSRKKERRLSSNSSDGDSAHS